MGKKTKKPVGMIGDFSDDEELEAPPAEEAPKKGNKKPPKGVDSEDEEVKPSKKEATNGKQKKKATKGKSNSDEEDHTSSEDEVQKAPTKGGKADKKAQTKSENGKKDKNAKVEDEEEEEESKPKKKSTTESAPKKPKKKKGGNWIEYEEEEEEDDEQSTRKKTSKSDEPKGKNQSKKQETKKQKKEEDEESEESDDEPKKGKVKGGKTSKQDTKKSAKQQVEDEESEESDEPKKGGKVKGGKAKPDKKSKQQLDEDEESEESDDEPKKGKTKGGKPNLDNKKTKHQPDDEEEKVTKEAPKKKGKKKGGDDYWDQEYEKDAEAAATGGGGTQPTTDAKDSASSASAASGGKKSKKNKNKAQKDESGDEEPTPTAPAQKEPKETKKESKETKKESNTGAKGGKLDPKQAAKAKGMSKALEMLRKQKEENERIEKEAEEQRKKEEEEARLILEEERRIEAEKQRAKEAKKKAAKERKKDQPPEQKQKAGDSLFLQQLREKGLLPKEANAPGAPGGKPKSMVYQTKKKQPKKPEQGKESTDADPTAAAPAQPAATTTSTQPEAAPEKEKEDDAVDDWENWEEHVDDVVQKLSKTNIDAAKPTEEEKSVPPAQPAQPAQPTQPAPVQQKPKADENGKKSGGKKDKKLTKKDKKDDDKPEANTASGDVNEETGEKELRSPICCILGHVDTGKTSLLDKIRQTDVQGSEAGGITQQIGATYFPMSAIQDKTKALSDKFNLQIKVPGLLVIDTPGHESFTNLRSRGSGLCDIAILVVDIMHALEPQTIESINLLRMRKTPFVVALNKVDRIYGWRSKPFNPFKDSLKIQDKSAVLEFETRTKETISAFAEHGLNALLYYKNTDFRKYVSLVPTSAHTGEGIPDLLMLLVQLTQKMMPERLHFTEDVQCTVLEVKVIEGLGTTLDVILVNGLLHEGDTIVLCGMNGPIVTTIRAVLAPQPLRELRVKGSYEKLKEIKAAMGVKIVAQDLEKAIAGSALFVAKSEEDIEDLKEEVQADFDSVLNSVDSSSRGVCVQASTLGSLEALLTFLKASKIPVSGVSIGPIHKRDVIRASVMLEHQPEFAVILAFDVKVEKDAQALADSSGVQIFTADIIYHLFDRFTAYMAGLKQKKREAAGDQVVWPCIVRIKPDCIFNKKAPLVLGMDVVAGTLRLGTPLCVPNKNFVDIGIVTGIEKNHKQQQEAKKGDEVAVKIESSPENAKEFGKHFDAEHDVCSRISRESIDLLVSLWGEELSQTDRQLIVKLKGVFKIQ